MRTVLSFILLLSFTILSAEDRPNIVILYADDMGYGDLGAQNPESKIQTPHLDRLAREGLRLTDAHSSSGICTPSRYALLTGRFHWRKFHGIVGSFGQPSFDNERTVADILKGAGYRTACIGKWHLGWDWKAIRAASEGKEEKTGYGPDAFDWSRPIPGGPLARGFDSYFGDDVPNFPPYAWIENDRLLTVPNSKLTITAKTAEGQWEARPGPAMKDWDFTAVMPTLTTRAVSFIASQKNADKPFLLYFPFTSPHAPIVPTKDFAGSSKAGGYGDFMAQTDWTVGQVLQALDQHGLSDNTLVIFSSDNGPEKYAYDRIKNFSHTSAGPLRGLKRDIWEGGHRVPFLVRWPGKVPAGAVSNGLLSQVDVFATIASLVGITLPREIAQDSYDQTALWTGRGPSSRSDIVHNTNPTIYAIRHENFVLIDGKSGGHSAVPEWFNQEFGYKQNELPGELYDLSKDLGQKKNLYEAQPEKVAAMKAIMARIKQPDYRVR